MRRPAGLLLLLCLGAIGTPIQAEIYKCKEATGSLLYTDTPCEADAETIAIMPVGATHFDSPALSDAAVAEDLQLLSEQETALNNELDVAQAAPGESLRAMPQAHALRMQLLAALESVRRQRNALLKQGWAKQEREKLVIKPEPDPDPDP